MSAADDIRRESMRFERMTDAVFQEVGAEVLRSIQFGSEITGAPGQPVDTGTLRASWQRTFPDPTHQQIATNLDYAEPIEEGIGPHGVLTLRSSVGGFHSVALTVAAMPRVVAAVTARVTASEQGYANGSGGWSGEDGG